MSIGKTIWDKLVTFVILMVALLITLILFCIDFLYLFFGSVFSLSNKFTETKFSSPWSNDTLMGKTIWSTYRDLLQYIFGNSSTSGLGKSYRDIVYGFKTKNGSGFTDSELNTLLKGIRISKGDIDKQLTGCTCGYVDNEMIYYRYDVLKAIEATLENRDLTDSEWD